MSSRFVSLPRVRADGVQVDVLVDEVICIAMVARSMNVTFLGSDAYPWAVVVDAGNRFMRPVDRLHRVVMDIAVELGLRKAIPDGNDLHHRSRAKEDNRLSNILVLDHIAHARLHARERFRLVGPKEKKNLTGFWREQRPGEVVVRHDLIGTSKPIERKASVDPPLAKLLDQRLVEMLPALQEEVRALDSGTRIPITRQGAWNDKRSRRMGVRRSVRLDVTAAETALVALLVRSRLDRASVVAAIGLEPREAVSALVARMLRRPAVNQAMSRWLRYRRLPKALVASARAC